MRGLAALAGFLIAVGVPATASAQQRFEFKVKDQAVTAELPSGYCENPAQSKMMADLMAKALPEIEIALFLLPCSGKDVQPADYYAIAMPRDGEGLDMDRATLLDMMRDELDAGREAASREANRSAVETGAELDDALGTSTAWQPSIHFDEIDERCALISGRLKGTATGVGFAIDKNMGGCMSAIGGRFFIAYRYSNADSGVPVAQLKAEARAFVESMSRKDD